MLSDLLLLSLSFGFGYVGLSYDAYAESRGWIVLKWFQGNVHFFRLLGLVSMASSAILTLVYLDWWVVFIVIGAGYFGAFLATRWFGPNVQYITMIGLPTSWIASLLFVGP